MSSAHIYIYIHIESRQYIAEIQFAINGFFLEQCYTCADQTNTDTLGYIYLSNVVMEKVARINLTVGEFK